METLSYLKNLFSNFLSSVFYKKNTENQGKQRHKAMMLLNKVFFNGATFTEKDIFKTEEDIPLTEHQKVAKINYFPKPEERVFQKILFCDKCENFSVHVIHHRPVVDPPNLCSLKGTNIKRVVYFSCHCESCLGRGQEHYLSRERKVSVYEWNKLVDLELYRLPIRLTA